MSPTSADDATTSTADADAKVYSPNLLTIGLSKGTLGRLGFRFKEDLSSLSDGAGETQRDADQPRGQSFFIFWPDPGLFLFIESGTSSTCSTGVIIVNNISHIILTK